MVKLAPNRFLYIILRIAIGTRCTWDLTQDDNLKSKCWLPLGKTTEEVIEDIINHEKEHSGIDWKKAAEGSKEEKEEALKKAHENLKELRNAMSDGDVNVAKSMGLLDENGM